MNGIDPREYALKESFVIPKGKVRVKGKRYLNVSFVKGPLPLPWLAKAGTLGGKALLVGLCLWYMDGMRQQKTFRIGGGDINKLVGISKEAALRGVQKLEKVGLIFVLREPGCKLVVTINRSVSKGEA